MFGFLKKISPDKVFDGGMSIIKGVGNFIDDITGLTEEEKVKYRKAAIDQVVEHANRTVSDSDRRSMQRGQIAYLLIWYTILYASVCAGCAIAGRMDVVENLLAIAGTFMLGTVFVTVVCFYFGGLVGGRIIDAVKGKRKKKE